MDDYINSLLQRQDEILTNLRITRKLEVNNFLAHEKAKDDLMRVKRDRIMDITSDPKFQDMKDPRTGKPNKEWLEWVLERRMEQDPDFVQALATFYQSQQDYVTIQADAMNLVDELNSLNARMGLLSKAY